MASTGPLSYADRAAFAVTSRLVSCLITESLLKAIYVPVKSSKAVGACVVLSGHAMAGAVPLEKPYRPVDVFVIVPLRTTPVLKPVVHPTLENEIGLVDPLDMLPWIYEICDDSNINPNLKVLPSESQIEGFKLTILIDQLDLPTAIRVKLPLPYRHFAEHATLSLSLDPLYLWKKFSAEMQLHPENQDAITHELRSSYDWQSTFLIHERSCNVYLDVTY